LLNFLNAPPKKLNAFVGLDGFVDEVVHVVKKRFDADRYDRVLTLTEYGKMISGASGLSLNVEIATIMKKLGGNGPIFALGLKKYGTAVKYIGCVGEGVTEPVFHELEDGAEVISVGDPGRTDAMEFEGGKIIRGKLSTINGLTWDMIAGKFPPERFAACMDRADLISFNNWTMILNMNGIWKHILNDVVPAMREAPGGKVIFFDLADPEKRESGDVLEALDLMRQFKAKGFDTILGLNRKEACEIIEIINGCKLEDYRAIELQTLCGQISEYLDIDCVIVHPVENAACIKDGKYYTVDGPYCAKPVLTTGAGDNFNAGFILGDLNKLSMDDCLLLGVMSSGFYVRNGKSADLEEIKAFIEQYISTVP
jgi:sugar/nucleoside kinase (ribokinase family)